MSRALVEAVGVRHSFRNGFLLKRSEVLHGISFSLQRGSVTGMLGSNGAGKTTLIQLIVGIRTPTSGAVRVAGRPAHGAMAKAKVGYLPERPYFYEHLTGFQFMEHAVALSGRAPGAARDRIRAALHRVGLTDAADMPLRRYSKGMLQRAGLAQAIVHDPELVVLDEPMSGLDPSGRMEIRELIRDLAAEGRTILFSSHVLSDVEMLCDQVMVISRGTLIRMGGLDEVLVDGGAALEIVFVGGGAELARFLEEAGASVETYADGRRALLPAEADREGLLRGMLDRGAHIVRFSSQRRSLEQYYREIGQS